MENMTRLAVFCIFHDNNNIYNELYIYILIFVCNLWPLLVFPNSEYGKKQVSYPCKP